MNDGYKLWMAQLQLRNTITLLESGNLSDFTAQLIVRLKGELNLIEDQLGILRSN